MNNPESIFDNPMFAEATVNEVNVFTGSDMTVSTLYFNPGQVLDYKNPNSADCCLFFFKGSGKCHLKNSSESIIDVIDGSIVYIPKGVSYKIENSNGQMILVESASSKIH